MFVISVVFLHVNVPAQGNLRWTHIRTNLPALTTTSQYLSAEVYCPQYTAEISWNAACAERVSVRTFPALSSTIHCQYLTELLQEGHRLGVWTVDASSNIPGVCPTSALNYWNREQNLICQVYFLNHFMYLILSQWYVARCTSFQALTLYC